MPLSLLSLLLAFGVTLDSRAEPTSENEARIKAYLKKFPKSDADKNGTLTLAELRIHMKSNLTEKEQIDPPKVERDIHYSDLHERNVLDFYPAKDGDSAGAPIYVWFHGGGFRQGDKKSVERGSSQMLQAYLDAGYAVVSCNYPLLDKENGIDYLDIMRHCGRAVQFIRSKSEEWDIDPEKVCIGGASAGALISQWLAYSDDLADKNAEDEVGRNSSRANVAIGHMQPRGTDKLATPFMSRDEAPLFIYTNAPEKDKIHHPKNAVLIRDRAAELGIPCVAIGGGRNQLPKPDEGKTWLQMQLEFCEKHLASEKPAESAE